MKNLLLPLDLGQPEKANAVLEEAKKRKEIEDVAITAVYVVTSLPGFVTAELPEGFTQKAVEDARARLESLVTASGLGAAATCVVRTGSPQHEILSLANEIGADLIIIASHKPGVSDYLLGSVAAAVVRHAQCSVLVQR